MKCPLRDVKEMKKQQQQQQKQKQKQNEVRLIT